MKAIDLNIDESDRLLCPVPWAFDYGFLQVHKTILAGATHVLPEKLNLFAICKAISESKPTVFPGHPSLFSFLLQGLSPFQATDLSSFHLVTKCGRQTLTSDLKSPAETVYECEVCLKLWPDRIIPQRLSQPPPHR